MHAARRGLSRGPLLAAAGVVLLATWAPLGAEEVWPGVEVLVRERAGELTGLRVGLLTNPTGVDRRLNSTIDLVRALPGVRLIRLFAPEHGIRGGFYAGERVDETRDPISGLPVGSLYGSTRRPTPQMLADLDLVLYDIQDVGHRAYTFVSSLTYMMEACEAAGVEVGVLDRPDPMGGNLVGGPMIVPAWQSFIGVHAVPQVYGMTPAEWARLIQAERTPRLKLRIYPLKGWRRGMTYGDLGWPWVSPSQHIPRWETSFFYAMTGTLGELGRLNIGVGTPLPFELIGAPGLDGVGLAERLNGLGLPGVRFRPCTFTPRYAAFNGQACQGIQIHLTDVRTADPSAIQLALMWGLQESALGRGLFPQPTLAGEPTMFEKALGDPELARTLAEGGNPLDHEDRLRREVGQFLRRRTRYLIYD